MTVARVPSWITWASYFKGAEHQTVAVDLLVCLSPAAIATLPLLCLKDRCRMKDGATSVVAIPLWGYRRHFIPVLENIFEVDASTGRGLKGTEFVLDHSLRSNLKCLFRSVICWVSQELERAGACPTDFPQGRLQEYALGRFTGELTNIIVSANPGAAGTERARGCG